MKLATHKVGVLFYIGYLDNLLLGNLLLANLLLGNGIFDKAANNTQFNKFFKAIIDRKVSLLC